MPTPKWIKGKGTADIAKNVPASVVRRVEAEEAGMATGRVPRTPPISASTAEPEIAKNFADKLLAAVRDGDLPKSLDALATETGASRTYVRFQVARPDLIKRVKDETGVDLQSDSTSVWSTGGAAPAASPAPFSPGSGTVNQAAASAATAPRRVAPTAPPAPVIEADPNYFYYAPGFVERVKAVLAAGLNPWFAGETGTGKSEGFERIVEKAEKGMEKASCNGESSIDDVLGHYTLKGTETVWVDGALPRSMKEGKILLCEEIDAAPAEVNLVLQRALESRNGRNRHFLNPRNGEEVTAKEGFLIAATANTTGGGDYSGLYAGVQTQNAAFRDRFVFFKVTYPDETAEIGILLRRIAGLSHDVAKKAVLLAKHARDAVTNGQIFTPVSTRSLLAFAQLYTAFKAGGLPEKRSIKEALDASIFHKTSSPSDATALGEMAQRVFGSL